MTNKEASFILMLAKNRVCDNELNEALDMAIIALNQESILDKIKAEIKEKIEQEEFARSVFRHEAKNTVKAEQCTGSIMAYKNVIILFDEYKAESEELKGENK